MTFGTTLVEAICTTVTLVTTRVHGFIPQVSGSDTMKPPIVQPHLFQAVSLACAMTPPEQLYPPEVVNAAEKMSQDLFKAYVDEQALILKTTYW